MATKKKATAARPVADQYRPEDVRVDYLRDLGIPETEIPAVLSKAGGRAGLEAAARAWLESNGRFLFTAKTPRIAPGPGKAGGRIVDRRQG